MEHTKLPWKVIQIKKSQYVDGFVYGIPDVLSMMHYGDSKKAKANVERIVKAVNVHNELVEALISTQSRLEMLINATPSGTERNAMTAENINVLSLIGKATQ